MHSVRSLRHMLPALQAAQSLANLVLHYAKCCVVPCAQWSERLAALAGSFEAVFFRRWVKSREKYMFIPGFRDRSA